MNVGRTIHTCVFPFLHTRTYSHKKQHLDDLLGLPAPLIALPRPPFQQSLLSIGALPRLVLHPSRRTYHKIAGPGRPKWKFFHQGGSSSFWGHVRAMLALPHVHLARVRLGSWIVSASRMPPKLMETGMPFRIGKYRACPRDAAPTGRPSILPAKVFPEPGADTVLERGASEDRFWSC